MTTPLQVWQKVVAYSLHLFVQAMNIFWPNYIMADEAFQRAFFSFLSTSWIISLDSFSFYLFNYLSWILLFLTSLRVIQFLKFLLSNWMSLIFWNIKFSVQTCQKWHPFWLAFSFMSTTLVNPQLSLKKNFFLNFLTFDKQSNNSN